MPQPFEHILFIGPDHKKHRGGIGAVLEIYSKNISPFQFIPTMSYRGMFTELFFFTGALLKLTGKLLTNRKIKLVDIHGAKDGSIIRKYFVCFIARKIFRKKIVFHIHAGAFNERYEQRGGLYKYFCRFLVNNSDALVVLSHRWDDFFRANFRIRRLLVINNPVEKRITEPLSRTNTAFTNFLFLGRIADHKGIFDLVEIIAHNQSMFRGRCILNIGGNHEVERLQTFIAENNIGDIVKYIGWTQADEKDSYFRQCDFFLLPTYEEAMPMTLLEAFSYGKSAITTPVGSIPEVVKDRVDGLLFEPGDKPALLNLLLEVMNNPALSAELGKNALAKATEFYPEAIKKDLEMLYAEIL